MGLVMATLATPQMAIGKEQCGILPDLLVQAQGNFQQIEQSGSVPALDDSARCGLSVDLSGQRSLVCRWSFPFRADAAAAKFKALDALTHRCLDLSPAAPEDGVNHPDTYVQHLYRSGDVKIALSLKDKSALGQTFVFLFLRRKAP